MFRIGFMIICVVVAACGGKEEKKDADEGGYSFEKFSGLFKSITPPFLLSDTGFLKNKDTIGVRFTEMESFISDSIKARLFGKGAKPRFISMVQFKPSEETSLYLVKATSGNKKAALMMAFDKGEFAAVFPFLVPDADPTTSQVSSVDRSFVITKTISQKKPGTVAKEGRDVYEYDADSKSFSLILTNPLNIENAEVINPIDTFPRTHKLAGDYGKDNKNFISLRDGRNARQLQLFMHLDKNKGECTGELKGDILLTSSNTAIYRQGGDPCVISFKFTGNSIVVKEDEGCGAHRGIDCIFDGTYTRKKENKPKTLKKKTTR